MAFAHDSCFGWSLWTLMNATDKNRTSLIRERSSDLMSAVRSAMVAEREFRSAYPGATSWVTHYFEIRKDGTMYWLNDQAFCSAP